ncbi:MAG: hypothetical protein M0Z70_11735 [Nitrospiraceae bacterium]|jgi:hypothetical protein|nr:hypothetical protein [Nitrospiraceae bacterium]
MENKKIDEKGKRFAELKGVTSIIKLQAENSNHFVVLITTWEREYAFIYSTDKEAKKAYDLACNVVGWAGVIF